MSRAPTAAEIIEHAHPHPHTGSGGHWIASCGGRPVVVRLWSAGEWRYLNGDDDAEWILGDLLGSSGDSAATQPAADVIERLGADAWWRWDASGPVRLT